jgi:hypothetical protein
MFAKVLLAAAGMFVLATPALCDQFYIVHDAATKRCVIAQQPPAEGEGVVVGDGAYTDRDSAETDMKTIHACIAPATGSDDHQ